MGGLGPGIGGLEYLVIGLVALLVVGPKDLPVLLRRLGQWMARARNMAAEFRASFDEMARQSELDELRKEVEALRTANPVQKLGADADAAFRDIRDGLNAPAKAAPRLETPEGLAAAPPPEPMMAPLLPTPAAGTAVTPVEAPAPPAANSRVRKPKSATVLKPKSATAPRTSRSPRPGKIDL